VLETDEGNADVFVLAGAPLTDLGAQVCSRIPVSMVDCLQAALWQPTTLAALRPVDARRGSFTRPAENPLSDCARHLHHASPTGIVHERGAV
jgi:hypothetical protein